MVTTTTSPARASGRPSKKPPPPMAPSPWIQTITGLGSAGVADRGTVTA